MPIYFRDVLRTPIPARLSSAGKQVDSVGRGLYSYRSKLCLNRMTSRMHTYIFVTKFVLLLLLLLLLPLLLPLLQGLLVIFPLLQLLPVVPYGIRTVHPRTSQEQGATSEEIRMGLCDWCKRSDSVCLGTVRTTVDERLGEVEDIGSIMKNRR